MRTGGEVVRAESSLLKRYRQTQRHTERQREREKRREREEEKTQQNKTRSCALSPRQLAHSARVLAAVLF